MKIRTTLFSLYIKICIHLHNLKRMMCVMRVADFVLIIRLCKQIFKSR